MCMQAGNKRKLLVELKNIKILEKDTYKMFLTCIKITTLKGRLNRMAIKFISIF